MKKILKIIIILAGLLAAVYLVKNTLDIRNKAVSGGASLSFSDNQKSGLVDDEITLGIILNTGTNNFVTAVELHLSYDPTAIEMTNFTKNDTIFSGTLPPGPPVNGEFKVTPSTFSPYNGSGLLGTLRIKILGPPKTSRIDFTSKTKMSAIGSSGDVLLGNFTGINIIGLSPTPIPTNTSIPTIKPTLTATPTKAPTATPTKVPTSTPTPTPTYCTDSDGGQNYKLKGNTCLGTSCSEDVCNGERLFEYYCNFNMVNFERHLCGDGKTCNDGKCVVISPTPTNTPVPTTKPTNTPTPTNTPALTFYPGDLDRSGKVNIYDYNLLIADFGKSGFPGFSIADIDKSGKVDIYDYNLLIADFGK